MSQLHSELTDELDRIWELRKASNDLTIEEIQAVPCPSCGAKAGEKCELLSLSPVPHNIRKTTVCR